MAPEWGLLSRKNKPLVHAALYRILTKSFYYGLFEFSGEWHQGSHEPIITKDLFDKVQGLLTKSGVPHKHRKHLFPFLGLASCANCDGAITAERQKKKYHYYRCTKKKGPCTEPFVREEDLAKQISTAIAKVALPADAYQQMIAWWAKEQQDSRQPLARFKEQFDREMPAIQGKLDRLLDAHLDGIIDRVEYQAKKESLLKQKVRLEEKLTALETGAMGWLEPCLEFLQAAHQAGPLASGDDYSSQKEFLKKIGSNFRVSAKTLRFSYHLPWSLLAKRRPLINWWRRGESNPRPEGFHDDRYRLSR